MKLASAPRARSLVADGVLALLVAAAVLAGSVPAGADQPLARPVDTLGYGLGLLAAAMLALRRVWPLTTLAIVVVAMAVHLGLGYPFGPIVFPVLIATYTVATRYSVRRSGAATAVAAVLLVGPVLGDAWWDDGFVTLARIAGSLTLFGLAPWAVGTVVRLLRESVQATRAEQLRRRTDQERLRTAQDVHDIVGHGLAAISMQAGVALHVLERSPAQAREVLAAIKASSEDALDELRVTLAVFRASVGEDRAPAPGLDRLPVLVDRTTEAGVPVELVHAGERTRLPASVEATAYRIVQESLTNVLRHAGPSSATVRIEYASDELTLDITDTGHGPVGSDGAGQGVTGMRARAAAVGGTLEAGPGPDGGFAVRARLPVRTD